MSNESFKFSSMQGLDESGGGGLTPPGPESGSKDGGLTPQVSETKIGELTPQASVNQVGGLTPQRGGRQVGGLTPQGSGGQDGELTPPNCYRGEDGALKGTYSPPSDNSPKYSPCSIDNENQPKTEESGTGVKLDFSNENLGLDQKHNSEEKRAASCKVKKEKEKSELAERNRLEVADSVDVPEDELMEGVLEKDDKAVIATFQGKATKNYVVKVFTLKKEATCRVCPRKTTKAFALFSMGQLIGTAKSDTVFCLLATCLEKLMTAEEHVVAKWIDTKLKKKIEKAGKQNGRDQIIHECKEITKAEKGAESLKADLKSCLAQGTEKCQEAYIKLLKDEGTVEFHSMANQIGADQLKELTNLGIDKRAFKCACGESDLEKIVVTIVCCDSLVGNRFNASCDKLACLVRSLEKTTNMTPCANPMLVEQSAQGRENINEEKAKAFHRLIFLGQQLVISNEAKSIGGKVEAQRLKLKKTFREKQETDEDFGTEEDIHAKDQHWENLWLKSKLSVRSAASEAKEMRSQMQQKIKDLSESIPEDKDLLKNQGKVSAINLSIDDVESRIEMLTNQIKDLKIQKEKEIRKNEVSGVKNFQTLLEKNPFEQITKINALIRSHRAKILQLETANRNMEEMRNSFARFYEGVLEVPLNEKLEEFKFEKVINIDQENIASLLESLSETVERCNLMQKQAKDIERDSWNRWYQQTDDTRNKQHADIVERAAELQAKNKILTTEHTELLSHIAIEKVATANMKKDFEDEVGRLTAINLSKDQENERLQREITNAHNEIKGFHARFENLEKKREEKTKPQEEEWTAVLGRKDNF